MAEHVAGAYPSGSRAAYTTPAAEAADIRLTRKHLTWGAIIAGVIIVLIVQLLLSLLGVGVGASTIDPTGETPSGTAFGIGAGLWSAPSLLSSRAAGWLADLRASPIVPTASCMGW